MKRKLGLALLLATVWMFNELAPWTPPFPVEVASAQGPTPYSYKAALLQSLQTATSSPTLPCGPAQGPPCTLDTGQANVVTFQVTGTFTGLTLNFDGTLDGVNYVALTCYTLDSQTAQSSVSATGVSRCNVNGIPQVRARVSAISTGSVTVVANGVNTGTSVRDNLSPSGAITGALRGTQTTAPTCGTATTASCILLNGGTDSFVTGQVSNPPNWAKTLVVTFNGTYAAAPACVAAWNGTAAYGYYVQTVASTTTTATLTLGGANSIGAAGTGQGGWSPGDKFSLICAGVQ